MKVRDDISKIGVLQKKCSVPGESSEQDHSVRKRNPKDCAACSSGDGHDALSLVQKPFRCNVRPPDEQLQLSEMFLNKLLVR